MSEKIVHNSLSDADTNTILIQNTGALDSNEGNRVLNEASETEQLDTTSDSKKPKNRRKRNRTKKNKSSTIINNNNDLVQNHNIQNQAINTNAKLSQPLLSLGFQQLESNFGNLNSNNNSNQLGIQKSQIQLNQIQSQLNTSKGKRKNLLDNKSHPHDHHQPSQSHHCHHHQQQQNHHHLHQQHNQHNHHHHQQLHYHQQMRQHHLNQNRQHQHHNQHHQQQKQHQQSQQQSKTPSRNNMKNSESSFSLNNQQNLYEPYWNAEKIRDGLSNKTLIEGKIRINQRSYEDSFVSDPNGGTDIYISGLKDRNRALNNDIVALKLKEKYYWKILDNFKGNVAKIVEGYEKAAKDASNQNLHDLLKKSLSIESTGNGNNKNGSDAKQDLIDLAPLSYSKTELLNQLDDEWFQRTAFVVGIVEKKNNRCAAGHLKLFPDKNKDWAFFSPNDSRLPRIKIKMSDCPKDFYTNPNIYANTLFIAQITDIPINSKYAIGEMKKLIGKDGDVEVETEGFLIENGIDYSEFDEEINQTLPQIPWSIPDVEYQQRRDLRNLCIFTIDPSTARDLDDALHCIKLSDDLYEVGVHIADVSYFVNENSLVDKRASERATSVYLVQKVIPMLPRLLCEHLCSLNPAVDRLTFSVIWKIKSNGDIIEEWFGRTIINSAVKLSYEHAQAFIEKPNDNFDAADLPPIRDSFHIGDIKDSVLNLDLIARKLREKRYENGCLTLNQVKISFVINRECGLPYGYNVYEQKDSNRLVEEFMLLANIAVAHRIYNRYPEKAVLRRHPTPNSKQIEQLAESFKQFGFDCDVSSSNKIQAFLNSIPKENMLASLTLTCLLTKTMQLAQYFCSGLTDNRELFYHYGLAVPLYTHFTSPIRRYPDILVHRLLASSLGYCEETKKGTLQLQSIAENCNEKKYSARVCSERSLEMFFSLFVNECGPLEEIATVIQIRDHSFDVLMVNLGIARRVYCDKQNIIQESIVYQKNELKSELSFLWQSNDKYKEEIKQTIQLFSSVNVILCKHESDSLKFNIFLKHPNEPICKHDTSKLIDHFNNYEQVYNQIIDTDPYICD